ncbi:MAG: hypothetical protein FGM41_09515 [Bacteroidetes bacterium]|nr:hypothetical protein [Bacteroidota bacterium]
MDFENIPFNLNRDNKSASKKLTMLYGAIFITLLILLFGYTLDRNRQTRELYKQIELKDQEFKKYKTKNGETVALQEQRILEMTKENMSLVKTVNKFKQIQGQVEVRTVIQYKEVKVPYPVEVIKYIDTHTNDIYVKIPLPFERTDSFMSISGVIGIDGVEIDSLTIPSNLTVTTGQINGGLFKKDKYQKASFLAIPGPIGQYLFNRGLLCPKEISKILSVDESKVWTLLTNLNEHYKYIDSAIVRHETVRPGNSENKSQSHKVAKSQSLNSNLESHFSHLNSFNKASFIESNLYMQNQLLKDSDYMSMWHSIEIRVPFLDKELIELAYQISPEIKAFEGQKKYLLIHTLGNLLPRAIWDRPKMGFTFPFQKWLKNLAANENSYPIKKYNKGYYTWSRFWAFYLQNNLNQ